MSDKPSIESLRARINAWYWSAMLTKSGEGAATLDAQLPIFHAALSELEAYRTREPALIARAGEAEVALAACSIDRDAAIRQLGKAEASKEALRAERDALKAGLTECKSKRMAFIEEVRETLRDRGKLLAEWNETITERDALQTTNAELAARVEALQGAMRKALHAVEALKLPCPMDPEAPQSQRNGVYASIALDIHNSLSSTPAADLTEHDARIRREEREWRAKRVRMIWSKPDLTLGDVISAILGPAPEGESHG